ncbi:MAG: MFS transporter [Actinobacteria bacterium]|nr:MFS transporter [Actinomycetota bacterium]
MSENVVQGVTPKVKAGNAGLMAVLMSLYFLAPSQGAVLASLASIGAAFPTVAPASLGYIATIVALCQIPAALIAGAVAGKKIKYRTLLLISSVLLTIAGCYPYLVPDGGSFASIIISRAIFGFALGTFYPIANALVTLVFDKESKRASVLGFGNAFFNAGAVVTQMLGGFLCLISWQTTFLTYLIGIVPLLLLLFAFKEPEHEGAMDEARAGKIKIPAVIWLYLVLLAVEMVFFYPMVVYLSLFMASANIGTPALVGTLLSFFTLVGIPFAALYGLVHKALGKWALPVGALIVAASEFVVFVACGPAASIPMLFVGMALLGIGQTFHGIALTFRIGSIVNPATAAIAMGFYAAFMNLGGFVATPITAAISGATGSLNDILTVAGIGLIVVGVIYAILNVTIKTAKEQEALAGNTQA